MTKYALCLFLMTMLASSTAFAVGEECSSDDDCPAGQLCWFLDGDTGLCDYDTCEEDADCGDCATCVEGTCTGLGLVMCVDHGDCDADEYCKHDADDPCSASCEVLPAGTCPDDGSVCEEGEVCIMPAEGGDLGDCKVVGDACVEQADCEGCQTCTEGFCLGNLDLECQSSLECEIGEYCALVLGDACASKCEGLEDNMCYSDSDCADDEICGYLDNGWDVGYCEENLIIPCETDDDCGACAVCVDNECKGTGAVMCEDNEDCPDDQFCHADLLDPCKNACEDLPTEACTSDADCEDDEECVMLPDGSGIGDCVEKTTSPDCETDQDCGPCEACVENECKGMGAIACETDDDCEAGEYCALGDLGACQNECKVKPDEGCTSDEDCAEGEVCEQTPGGGGLGICAPDETPEPSCETDDDCTAPATCVDSKCAEPAPCGDGETCGTDGTNGGGGGGSDDATCAMTGFAGSGAGAPLALLLLLVAALAVLPRSRRPVEG